jgi:predicted lipid-binding transport protein (Tim44 family)
VGSFFEGLLFGLTEALPALLLIAALALIPILLVRRARKKRKARRAAFTAPAEQPAAETRPPEEGEEK